MTGIITSQELSKIPSIRFAMSTRLGGTSPEPYGLNLSYKVGDAAENVSANRQKFFEHLGVHSDRLALPHQCHSARVVHVEAGGEYDSCDGLVTATPGTWLGISIADCVPVALADVKHHAIAVLHAGWRGTSQRIMEQGVSVMAQAFGTMPEDIIAYIGPSASACCYEVGPEVAAKFSPAMQRRMNGSIFLDLKQDNKQQLMQAGVPEAHIETSPYCTICTPNIFHSYRREKERAGRMMAVIGLLT